MSATTTGSGKVIINVRDVGALISFYRDVLEVTLSKHWQAPAGDAAIFELGPHWSVEFVGPPHTERIDPVPARGVELMIGVDDAEACFARLSSAGVSIARGLIENPWGDRSFGIDDPLGLRVWIFEDLARI